MNIISKKSIAITVALSAVLTFGIGLSANSVVNAAANYKHCKTQAEAQEAYRGGLLIIWDVPNPEHKCPICGRVGKQKGTVNSYNRKNSHYKYLCTGGHQWFELTETGGEEAVKLGDKPTDVVKNPVESIKGIKIKKPKIFG